MSNSLAIAAVTATLRMLLLDGLKLDPEVADPTVTAKPPDKVRGSDQAGNQLNLFLYHVEEDAAWHDTPMPNQGPNARPPLSLNLYYLLTAYGQGDDDVQAHQLLGRAMRTLSDTPILKRADIRNALRDNDLHQQMERVRITRQPMTLDEMSKLWSTLQTQYRISVAYQVSVILIESTLTTRAALPILRRGSEDQGVNSQADTIPPYPMIEDLQNHEPIVIQPRGRVDGRLKPDRARLGDRIQLKGHHLSGERVVVRFSNPRLRVVSNPPARTDHPQETKDEPIISSESANELVVVQLPDDAGIYPAGLYTAAVVVFTTRITEGRQYNEEHISNEVALALAPEFELKIDKNQLNANKTHDIELTLDCRPRVRPEQRVAVFLGTHNASITRRSPDGKTITVQISDVATGDYLVRLRVDGVDSFPIVIAEGGKLAFDDNQKVTVR